MMILGVILVPTFLWNFCVGVDFYLETIRPAASATELIEKIVSRGTGNGQQELRPEGFGHFREVLHECNYDSVVFKTIIVWCRPILDSAVVQQVYEVENFYVVSDLELSRICSKVKIDGFYCDGILTQVLSASVQPLNYMTLIFNPATGNLPYIEYKVKKFLGPLTKNADPSEVKSLIRFFSANHIGYFSDDANEIFYQHAEVMRRLILASGYNAGLGKQNPLNSASSRSPNRSPPQTGYPRPQSPPEPLSRVSSACSTKCNSGAELRSQTFKKKCLSRCMSSIRSMSQALFRSQPRPRPQPQSLSLAKSKSRSLAFLRTFSRRQAKVTPQPLSLSESDVLIAAGFLALKIFDPCLMSRVEILEPKAAEKYCAIYCQFLSMTIHVYGDRVSERCDNLKMGYCKNNRCVCKPDRGAGMEVNMVFCNNALRLLIYKLSFDEVPSKS